MKGKSKIILIPLAASSLFLAAGIFLKIAERPASILPSKIKGIMAGETPTLRDYASLASQLAQRINAISPTPSFGAGGWLAVRVVFLEGGSSAYLEYTDTHVALRLLIGYTYISENLETKVLATFVPNELNGWTLRSGQDEARTSVLLPYKYNGDSGQWIPEMK